MVGTLHSLDAEQPANDAALARVAVVFAIPGAGLIRGDERWERVQADQLHLAPE